MLKKLTLGFFFAALLSACGNEQPAKTDAQNPNPADDGKHFGAVIDASNAITYDELIPKMATTDSLAVKVSGKVGEVCQKKGCWMMLVSEQPGQPEMRVTFKDYAFFMPKDLTGKRVVMDGYAIVEETPVDLLRHYAEDAGKSKEEIEKITEPKREVAYEASGVLILDK
jgi:hypothetical protein